MVEKEICRKKRVRGRKVGNSVSESYFFLNTSNTPLFNFFGGKKTLK
jgi:hypothetical protein